jgi:PAS domain S-box-containing protein
LASHESVCNYIKFNRMSVVPSDATPPSTWGDAILLAVREPMLVLDANHRVKQASASFYREFRVRTQEVLGRSLHEVGKGEWNIPELRKRLDGVLATGREFSDYRVEKEFPGIGRRSMLLSGRQLHDPSGNGRMVLLGTEDITERQDAAIEMSRQRQWFATTLASIGDAVITTDTEAHVTFMNATAKRLTGWKLSEAMGRPLHEVFNIVNEETRNLVESPVTKAIRMGEIVGLANHTMLIAKDGMERPIDDSAAPIRDEAGNVLGVVMVFHDITERRAAERAQARLAEIVESSDDAIVAKDLNGIINAWNRGAERLFGYTAQEAIGKSITIIIPPERLDEEAMVLERIRRGERVDHFETIRQRKDRSLVDISLSVSPIRDCYGKVIGASKTARDITERRRFQAELEAHLINEQSLRMEAEAANRSKDLFLATLSHELRTPLNAIVGWVNILRSEGCSKEDLREGLDVIDRNTKTQVQLIEDVLDVSRIVSGKLQLNMHRCELASIIDAAILSVRPAADAKGVQLEAKVDPSASPATCDPTRVQQVVWNLLSNAVKFTPKGGRVTVSLDREHSMSRIVVRDTGQGISAAFLPYVFDRFRQADSTTRRKFGGLGLGLSIVKQLVEMHGGRVRAESQGEGHGATFTVQLPIAAVNADQPAEGGEALAVASDTGDALASVRLDGLRLVVVDDEPDARRLLSKVLTDAGAVVTAAATVLEALQAIEKVRPHVLISDIAMPDQDGYDLIRQVRGKGHTAQLLPAIALTAFADKSYARNVLLAGFQVHVPKPVESDDLIAMVASLAGRTG